MAPHPLPDTAGASRRATYTSVRYRASRYLSANAQARSVRMLFCGGYGGGPRFRLFVALSA